MSNRFVASIALAAALAAPALAETVTPITDANADQFLRPGDVMIKLINTKSHATSWGVAVTEAAMKAMYEGMSDAERRGNPAAVHVAIYVGNGQTAEAHNYSDEDAAMVSLRHVSHHAGYLWLVYRPANAQLGVDAAKVARTWATGKMKYSSNYDLAIRDAWFGPHARSEALGYGHGASVVGGPPGHTGMFCSQFVIAAYQGAVVSHELQGNPQMQAGQIQMYPGMDRHASITSPLNLHGHLKANPKAFHYVGMIVTQKSR